MANSEERRWSVPRYGCQPAQRPVFLVEGIGAGVGLGVLLMRHMLAA